MRKNLRSAFVLFAAAMTLTGVGRAVPSFTRESGIRLSSGSPQVILPSTGSAYRMYFIKDYEVHSATSANQLDWTEEGGVRLSSTTPSLFNTTHPITGCSLLPLDAGGFRMLYSIGTGTGPFAILIATSADGMSFGSPTVSTAVILSTSAGEFFVGSPRLTEIPGGNWRLFFTLSFSSASDTAVKFIFGALSSDEGATWALDTFVTGPVGELALSTRTDQRVRLFYTAPLTGSTTNSTLLSALFNSDTTGKTFESGVRFSTDAAVGALSNPVVIHSTESFRYRLFYNYTDFTSTSPPPIFSAITASPDPQSITPASVNNTDGVTGFTVRGEIFSPTPTVKLAKTGQPDITSGGSEVRTNDQTITVNFNPFGQEIGNWDVVVTNVDLQTGTDTGGLTITFPPALVTIDNTVLRPRLGTPANINVQIFNPGKITVRLYTMDGRLIQTLLDQEEPIGVTLIPWYGNNSEGKTVASGTYLLTFEGPKLTGKKKIVVIR
jgi:hypothetical protein